MASKLEETIWRLTMAFDLFQWTEADKTFLKTIIVDEESFVYGDKPESKGQWSEWNSLSSPRPKMANQVWRNIDVLFRILLTRFNMNFVVHHALGDKDVAKQYFLEEDGALQNCTNWKYCPCKAACSWWKSCHQTVLLGSFAVSPWCCVS